MLFFAKCAILLILGSCTRAKLSAQDPPGTPLAVAKALDGEISNMKTLPETAKAAAIEDLARRIRQQPKEYRVALATNLVSDGADGSSDNTLLDIANTLAEALRAAPRKPGDSAYRALAELVRYGELATTLDDPNYAAALNELEREEKRRSGLDFSLADLSGHTWRLKRLEGKVVLVVFWATWCPPCRLEVPHLIELQRRFAGKGLEILAISDEEPATVRRFVAENKIGYRVLLDPGGAVRELYAVSGIPQTFVYDRRGKLVAHAPASPAMPRLLGMLERSGLR